MKQYLLTAFFLLLAFAGQTFAREIDLRVGGIGLGGTEAQVLRRLGAPRAIEKGTENACGGGWEKTFRYDGLSLVLLSDENGANYDVIGVEVTSAAWTVSGVKIGAHRAAVRARFGASLEAAEDDGLERWSYVNWGNDGFAGFYFAAGKLVKISWQSNLC